MPSRVFESYSEEKKKEIIRKLLKIQDNKCLFCDGTIDDSCIMDLNEFFKKYEIDHIKPLTEGGRDDDSNWGILHKECNKKKGAKPLFLAKRLYKFKKDRESLGEEFTLGKVLEIHGINSQPILIKIKEDYAEVKFHDYGKEKIVKTPILEDPTGTPFSSIFISLPITCIYHDSDLNPRPIGENATKLIEEFYEENSHPQLHVCLARMEEVGTENDYKKVKILLFDGQHKAVAQIYNERRYLLLRIFVKGDKETLKETNWRAHTDLRQIEFFRSIAARVGSGLFAEKFKEYLEKPGKPKSEASFINSLPYIEREKIKKEFLSWLKHGILHPKEFDPESEDNLMTPYIEEEKSRKRDKPISYDAFEKTFIKLFVYNKPAEEEINPESEEYFRIVERKNVVKLMSMIAEKVLINKFDNKIGAHKLEERLRKGEEIPEPHIKAYRIFRPKTFEVWCEVLKDAIVYLLKIKGKLTDAYAKQGKIFWSEIDKSEWEEIGKKLDRIFNHKVWLSKNSDIIDAINSTRKEICQKLLTEGKIGDKHVMDTPIDFKYVLGV
ncbi:MAG TPA: HNH endonuclease [Candidatus Altiarchaeales archaeon]|nr:HNH endonuclease [Candidatus Altiarchaeales archaeon]